jgi:hypothetical protein
MCVLCDLCVTYVTYMTYGSFWLRVALRAFGKDETLHHVELFSSHAHEARENLTIYRSQLDWITVGLCCGPPIGVAARNKKTAS